MFEYDYDPTCDHAGHYCRCDDDKIKRGPLKSRKPRRRKVSDENSEAVMLAKMEWGTDWDK